MSRLLHFARSLLTAPTVRTDAVGQHGAVQAASGAAVANPLSGLGGLRDSGAAARPNTQRQFLTDEELIALLRGGIYRRIVTLKPLWATAREWHVTDDTPEERPLDAELRRLKVRRTFRRADIWARALGESRVMLITDDPAALDEPLEPERVRKLHRLEVLDRREFTPVEFNTDPNAGPVGEPTLYHVHPRRAGVARGGYLVHASRLLRFYGDDLPPSEEGWTWPHWGADAVGQTLWDGIRNLAMMGAGGARIAQELSVAVFQVHPAKQAGDQREGFLARLTTLNMMKSIANAVLLYEGEDYRRVPANPSGFRDLSEHAERQLATMTGTPLALLVGLAPGGLNTDGESWQVMWFKDVAAYREDRYRDPLETIVELLYWSERGAVPDQWDIEFLPLGELSEKEKAEIRMIHTQADVQAIMEGILSPHEARSRYTQPGGFQTELQPVDEIVPSAGTPGGLGVAPPEVEEEVRRLIEGGPVEEAQEVAPTGEAPVEQPAVAPGTPSGEAGPSTPEAAPTLNGAQIQAVLSLLDAVAAGLHAPATVVEMVTFVGVDRPTAERLVSTVKPRPPEPGPSPAHTDAFRGDAIDPATGVCVLVPAPEPRLSVPVGLERRDPPHVTVLYVGRDLDDEAVAEVVQAATEAAREMETNTLREGRVVAFPPGEHGVPVVVEFDAWPLHHVYDRLLRSLAHVVTAKQHARFRPHLTLGYAPSLTSEQLAQLMEVDASEVRVPIVALEVRRGGELVATIPVGG